MRAEASRPCIGQSGLCERTLLDSEICIQIDLSGLDGFVPKPKGDDAGVDPSLEELNGGGVTQDVGGYVFVDESRALLASGSGVLFDEPFDGVAAQDAAATAGEQWVSWSCRLMFEPVSENRDCLRS